MREVFPHKRPGDPLTAEHVNNLSEVARRTSGQFTGSFLSGINGTFQGQTGSPRFQLDQVIVSEVVDATTYRVYYRYWDQSAEEWKTNESVGPYTLDSSEAGVAFVEDQKVAAYWHPQRKAFMPLPGQGALMKKGKATEAVAPNELATVRIYDNTNQPTDEYVENVRHDWITSGYSIQPTHELFIAFFADEGLWRIVGAPCPT